MKKLNPALLFLIGFTSLALLSGAQTPVLTAISNFGSNPGAIQAFEYVPANMPPNAPLVLVLHGCTQTAEAYATETQWNTLADSMKFYVAYGQQTSANDATECFDYYLLQDNGRGVGQAASLKQITDYMKANYSIDSTRVFVTGLSAGGAMTTVMCTAYPDVFAAGAEMSGLPFGCATSMTGADLACLGQVSKTAQQWGDLARAQYPSYTGPWPRMAIFHGTSDIVVSDQNDQGVIGQFTNLHGCDQTADYTVASFNGNSLITYEAFFDSTNVAVVEYYTISGMAHGTAIYPGTCYQQGGNLGTENLAFNESFYSPFWAAQFFGILKLPASLDSISGPSTVTYGQQGITYSVPAASGATYTWTIDAGGTIASGQGTNSITVNWDSVSGTVSVTEMPTGGCEQGPAQKFVRPATHVGPGGVAAVSADMRISLYPNPADNMLFIITNNLSVEQINIYNATGSLVIHTDKPVNNSIDISELASGMYVAEVRTKDAVIQKKWVKM